MVMELGDLNFKTLLKCKLARCKPSQHGKWFFDLDQTLVKRHVSQLGNGCGGISQRLGKRIGDKHLLEPPMV
jgi:hypothetical protein